MSELIDDFDDIEDAIPHDDIFVERGDCWQNLFDKYSNCNDGEEDGISMSDLTFGSDEEEEFKLQNIQEAEESETEGNQQLQLYTGNFWKLPNSEKYKKVSLHFSPELIQALIEVYQEKFKSLSQKNLPFWSGFKESSKETETISEQSIQTPKFLIKSRQSLRSREDHRSAMMFNGQEIPAMCFNKFRINGKPLSSNNSPINMSNTLQLPDEVQKIMERTGKFRLQVFERSYDITVNDSPPANAIEMASPLQAVGVNTPKTAVPHKMNFKQKLFPEPRQTLAKDSIQLSGPSKDAPLKIPPPKVTNYQQKLIRQPTHSFIGDSSSSDDDVVIVEDIKEERDSDVEIVEEVKAVETVKAAEIQKTKEVVFNEKSLKKQSKKAISSKPKNAKESNSASSKNPAKSIIKSTTKKQEPTKIIGGNRNQTAKTATQKEAEKPDKSQEPKQAEKVKESPRMDEAEEQKKHGKSMKSPKTPSKRQAPPTNKAAVKIKKIRKRFSDPPESSSDEDELMNDTTIKSKLTAKSSHSKLPTEKFAQLTLDDISCGSSCSTVTSGDDKIYQPAAYSVLRQEKKLEHRQQKLMMRSGMSSMIDASTNVETAKPDKNPKKVEIAKRVELKGNESSSTYESDDDYIMPLELKMKRAAKKERWENKLAARENLQIQKLKVQIIPQSNKPAKTLDNTAKNCKTNAAGKENRAKVHFHKAS